MALAVDAATTAAFNALGRLRKAPAFHPVGVAYNAIVDVTDDRLSPSLSMGEHRAVARFSRGIGWTRPWPDVHGIGVRIIDAHGPGRHQDLLVSSVASANRVRFVPSPRRSVFGPLYSSIAPYDSPAGRIVIGARPLEDRSVPLEALDAAVSGGYCRFELLTASPRLPWCVVGTVTALGPRLPESEEHQLALDPFNTHQDMRPSGWLNRLRRPAYDASQRGRASATRQQTEDARAR